MIALLIPNLVPSVRITFIWVIILIPIAILFLEYKQKVVTNVISKILENKYKTLGLLIWYAIITGRFYLAIGEEVGYGDGPSHLSYIWHSFYALKHNVFYPIWTFMIDSGVAIS